LFSAPCASAWHNTRACDAITTLTQTIFEEVEIPRRANDENDENIPIKDCSDM
jgi:hypothetical protein